MAEPDSVTGLYHCNRCDRGFTTEKKLNAHVVKHPDYEPALHSEIDD